MLCGPHAADTVDDLQLAYFAGCAMWTYPNMRRYWLAGVVAEQPSP